MTSGVGRLIDREDLLPGQFVHKVEELRQEFSITQQTLQFAALQIDFYRVADPDSILDETTLLQTHRQLSWQPYWALVSAAAYGLADELSCRDLARKTVLDLGCGVGLAGTIAAACGADVVFADQAPPALKFAAVNSWPWRERVRVVSLNWSDDHIDQAFDLILGCDIVYDRHDLPQLDRFWRAHLKETGLVLLSDPNRPMTRCLLEEFAGYGWDRRDLIMGDSARDVRIVELRAKAE